jgi:arsenical pump membrane protein
MFLELLQEPLKVLIFFISITLFSLIFNHLQLYKYLIVKLLILSRHQGKKLFVFVFLLSAITSYFLSNDVVILMLTPLLLNLLHFSDINPLPYLFTMFFTANIASIGLISSNTTNLIIYSEPYSFFAYFSESFFPTLFCLVLLFILLNFLFSKEINKIFHENKVKSSGIIKEKRKLSIALGIFVFTLLFYFIGITEIWIISSLSVLLTLLFTQLKLRDILTSFPYKTLLVVSFLFLFVAFLLSILPLSNSLSFDSLSFFEFFSLTVLFSLFNSFFLNIPSTYFLTQVIQEPTGLIQKSLIISSNFGANLFISGSLAGLMWFHMIKEKKVKIKLKEFVSYGLFTTLPLIFLACLFYYL